MYYGWCCGIKLLVLFYSYPQFPASDNFRLHRHLWFSLGPASSFLLLVSWTFPQARWHWLCSTSRHGPSVLLLRSWSLVGLPGMDTFFGHFFWHLYFRSLTPSEYRLHQLDFAVTVSGGEPDFSMWSRPSEWTVDLEGSCYSTYFCLYIFYSFRTEKHATLLWVWNYSKETLPLLERVGCWTCFYCWFIGRI